MTHDHLRNLAVVAHVDHGKTTLLDSMLWQSGIFRSNQEVNERVMDSMDLERERGITIMAKNTAIQYEGVQINIVDTPGHADFGGEVERTLRLVDGIMLLVDAAEGPLPQTRFVLEKALEQDLPSVVVINKIDRKDARPAEVVDAVYDLYIDLGASVDQIEFPVLYTVATEGRCKTDLEEPLTDLRPLFDELVESIPPPVGDPEAPLQVLVTSVEANDYLGPLALGRVVQGTVREQQAVSLCHRDGTTTRAEVTALFGYSGLERERIEEAGPGAIVSLAGMEGIGLGESISEAEDPEPLPPIQVDEPTVSMEFRINDTPMTGQEGDYVTSRQLKDRLEHEDRNNLAIRVEETDSSDSFHVYGRGALQLSVLVEQMRREGYEFCVGMPRVITKEIDGTTHEPYEHVTVDVPEEFVGVVTERLGERKGVMTQMKPLESGRVRMEFEIPSRGLIGYRSEFLTDTKGTGLFNHVFDEFRPWAGEIRHRTTGTLVADRPGRVTGYACLNLQERGRLFVEPNDRVYEGMVVGENRRDADLEVNITREKKLTNHRAAAGEKLEHLEPAREMDLEDSIEFVREDELVEVTPQSVRIRKRHLDPHLRKQAALERKSA